MTDASASRRFEGLADLARLPWFGLREGRVVLADPSVGPIVDAHAHLALSYLLPPRVRLGERTGRTEHYLPRERAFDLDGYLNRNFAPEDLSRMKRDLSLGSLTARGMRATHTAPNLLGEMGDLGIAASVLLPIDMPAFSWNAETYLGLCAETPGLASLGSVHPFAPAMERRLDRQQAMGARGVKVHPAAQLVAPDHPRATKLYRLCGERGLPVFFHCGPVGIETRRGRARCQVWRYRWPIETNPETTFVLGHSGALQMEEALALAKEHPNVCLELASQGLENVRRILDRGPEDRVLFGTDWPFYPQAIGLAKVLIATEGRERLRRKVLYENAVRIFGLRPPAG